jgi:hypothetical protein
MEYVIFNCPHCYVPIMVFRNEINCRIFRHAILKINNQNINPHASKEECNQLINEEKIYGCGKPFRLDENNNAVICEYI